MIVGQRTRDGCAVETRALAEVLKGFIDEWTRQHPDLAPTRAPHVSAEGHRIVATCRRGGDGRYVGNEAVGGIIILHERTRQLIDPGGHSEEAGVPIKTIRNILHCKTRLTELRLADALVTAADRTLAFHDGTLRVVQNPLASSASRARCCAAAAG